MRQDLIVSRLVRYLTQTLGVKRENIVILVALGTHRPMTEEEMRRLVTPEIYQSVRVENHDCQSESLVYVGTTSRGTQVRVNPLCVNRKVILIGGTVHHLMSGFGGGRKSILPGVCAKSTIAQNHLHCLHETEPRSADTIGMAKLLHNPVNEDMLEAAAFVSLFSASTSSPMPKDSIARFCAGIGKPPGKKAAALSIKISACPSAIWRIPWSSPAAAIPKI
ncbi:MAG: lactate racemase domain-containing protein [Christensenellales bacterium]